MAFGAQIKLSVDKSNKSQFRGQIQQLVNEVSASNPIKLKNFKVDLSGREKQQIINQLQETLRNTDIEIKIKSIDASSAVSNLRKQLTTMLSGLRIEGLKEFLGDSASTQALENATKAARDLAAAQGDVKKKAKEANAAMKEISAISNVLSGTNKKILNLGEAEGVDELKAKYRELSAELDRAKTQEGELQAKTIASVSAQTSALVAKVNAIRQAAQEAQRAGHAEVSSAQEAENAIKRLNLQRANLSKRVESYIAANPRAYETYRTQFDAIRASLAEISSDAPTAQRRLLEVSEQFANITTQARVSGNAGKTFFSSLREGWRKFGGWSIITRSMMMAINGFKNMVSAVKEVDAAMTELRKVTDLTSSSYNKFYLTAVNNARTIGATLSDTINATADFARLGFSISDAADLAKAALTYKNVGDGINDISQATESLISTLKAFYNETDDVSGAAQHIIDSFNEVGNNFAISAVGVGEALQRSAAALSAAGNTLEQSIGLATAANNIVQNPEQVGTALKTLSMYLRAAKTEAEEAGVETDGMAESVSKLREQILALTGNKVDIQIDENTFKSTYDIIKEISEVWDELSDISRANLTELMGGKRNANVLTALIKNFGDAEKAAKTAMESIGSAARENEKYLNSIAGKVAQMQAAFQSFSGSALDSNVIKFFVDLGTALLNVGTAITNLHLLVPTITAVATAVKGINLGIKVNNLVGQITTQANAGVPNATIMAGLSQTLTTMTAAQQRFAVAQLQAAAASQPLNAELRGQIGSLVALTAASGGAATAGAMLKTVWAGVKATFSSFGGILLVVQLVISGIQMLVDAHNRSIQDSIDKANEYINAFDGAKNSYSSSIKTLKDLSDKFNTLSEGVNENGENVSLTASEYENYLSIVDKIIEISPSIVSGYDSEGRAVLNYKTALQDAISVQEEFIANQRDVYLGRGNEIFNGKQNEYRQYAKDLGKAGEKLGNALNPGGLFSAGHVPEWNAALKAVGIDWIGGFDTWGNSADKLLQIFEKREQFITMLKSVGTYTPQELENIKSYIYGLGSAATQLQSILDEQANYLAVWSQEQDWYKSIPFGAIDEFADGLSKVISPLASYTENIKRASAYGGEFAAHFGSDQATLLAAMATGMTEGTTSVEDFNEALEELKSSWTGDKNALQMIVAFWESMIPAAESGAATIEQAQTKIESMSDALKRLKEGYDLLSTAQKEMDETGSISNSSLQSVVSALENGEKITDYIYEENGLLQLNAEKWKERSEAILQSNIVGYTEAIVKAQQQIDDILGGMSEEMSEEEASKSIENLRKQIEEYEKELQITQMVLDSMHSSWSDPFDTTNLQNGIDEIKSEAEGLQEILERLNNGAALTQEELASLALKYPDIMQQYDLSSADLAEATQIISEMLDACDSKYNTLIDDQIALVESLREEAINRGYGEDLIDNMIANLKTLKGFSIVDLLGLKDKEAPKSLSDLSNTIKEIKNAADTMNDIRAFESGDGDFINTLSKIVEIANSDEAKNLGKNLSDFVEVIDGKVVFHEADVIEWIDSIIDGLREIKDESGNQVISDDLINQLKEAARAAEETDNSLADLGDTISNLQSAKSLYQTIKSGDYDILDMLSSVVDMAEKTGKSLSDFFDIGEDGVINFKTDGLSSYIDELCNKFVELGGITPEAAEQLKEFIKTTEKATNPLDKFSDSLSSLQSAIGILNDVNAGDNFIGTLQSIISLVKSTDGEKLENFLTITDGKIAFDSSYIRTYIDSVIEAIDTTPEIKDGLRAAAEEALKTEEAFKSLGDAISGIETAASFLTEIKSGESDPLSMIQTAMKMSEDLGSNHAWTDFVSGFDPTKGIEWDEEAVRKYSDALVDAALAGTNLEDTLPGITQYLKDQAAAAVEASQGIEELGNGMRSAIQAGNSFGRNIQLTLSSFQQLLDVDKRYAQAVDYVNGQLTINRDRYNELTGSILQETLAEIEARTQAIVLSSEYQNLINNVGNLNAAQQARLNSLNAEIMSYGVLANELNNATSAYQRFMNSSDTDSNGRYAQAVRAMGVITDTMENKDSEIFGKIGRDQFKLAVDFVLGENVKVNTPEFEKGLATVRRYLTKDAEGVSNFYDDLISHGIIDAASGAMNTTVQEISQKLGISKEAVRSMLEELERYQAEPFDWSMLDPGEDAAAAESSIQSLEDAVAEAKAAAEDAKAAVAELSETKVTLDVSAAVSAAGSVSSALSNILTQIANINRNGKITISADVKNNTNSGTSGGGGSILGNIISGVSSFFSGLLGGKSSAGGTLNAAGGKTLVGEIGPEIVVDPKTGTWRTVGIHGPEFVNLTRGSIVLNSKQTADLLGSSRTSSSGPSKAYANQVVLADSGGGGGKTSTTKTNSGGNLLTDIFNTFKNGVQNVVNNVKNFVNNVGNGVAGNVKKPTTNNPTPKNNNNNNNGGGGGGGGNTQQAEEEAETLREIYEKVNNELEHLIEHQEFLYKVADRGLDFHGMEASLREQARLYRKIMENSYAAVEEMKKQGMTDTDEDLQAMERAAWSAYESMYDAFDKIRALYTDSLHEKIDNIQKAYDNLKNAMAELSDEGGISVDTFQALTQHGLQYLSFLEDADGQFRVNTDAIQQMIAAEKEQLAVETALSYVSSIQEALGDGQQNRVAALVDATQQISDNTWGAVYAQAALLKEMGLTDDQYNQVIFNINALRDLAGNVITDISDKTEQSYKDQEDALDKILDFTEKLIEAETKDRIKAIENEVKAYKNIINLKKESLKVTKDENSYQRSVSEKVQEIAQLQAKIDKLALDDSRSAQAERAKLVEDLAKLQTDLSDYQADHAYEAQVTALDKMSEAYEESRQSEIDALEASISSTEKVYQLALERIRTGWSTLYTDLITWNTEQGDVINQEITENWNKAGEAVQKYGSYLAALENLRGLDVGGSLSVLPKYHGGGVVGDAGSINDSEVMAILNKGELVVDEGGKKGLYRIIDFQKNLSERLGALVGNIRLPSSAGMMPNLAMAGAGAGGGMVFNPTINVEINHNGSMSSADARKYGNDVADSALERMYNAFERRGVTGVFGTRLKQST